MVYNLFDENSSVTNVNKFADANTSGIAVTCACSETLATQNASAKKE